MHAQRSKMEKRVIVLEFSKVHFAFASNSRTKKVTHEASNFRFKFKWKFFFPKNCFFFFYSYNFDWIINFGNFFLFFCKNLFFSLLFRTRHALLLCALDVWRRKKKKKLTLQPFRVLIIEKRQKVNLKKVFIGFR